MERKEKEYELLYDILKQEHERHNHYNRTFLTALAIVLGATAFTLKEGVSEPILIVLCAVGVFISAVWGLVTWRIRFDTEFRFFQIRRIEKELGWENTGIYTTARKYFKDRMQISQIYNQNEVSDSDVDTDGLKQPSFWKFKWFKVGWTGQVLPLALGLGFSVATVVLIVRCSSENGEQLEPVDKKVACRVMLEKAVRFGRNSFIEQAIFEKCDLDDIVLMDKVPLHLAAEVGNLEIVRLLIDEGVDVNNRRGAEQTPLHFATLGGHVEVAKALIGGGANIEAINKAGFTPLHFAVRSGQHPLVVLLLASGADPEATSRTGVQPIDVAREWERPELVQLLQGGMDDSEPHSIQRTPQPTDFQK